MSHELVGLLAVLILLVLLALNLPIYGAFAIVGFLGYSYIVGFRAGLSLLGFMPYSWSAHYTLSTLPMFLLMGMLAAQSGITKELFDAAYKWLGRLPGGLAIATMAACTGFAACTGSSVASASAMGYICLPEMKRRNYNNRLAAGTIAAGGTLGILIPPSTAFIIYGVLTEQSIGKLFIAGILPGIMLSTMFMVQILVMCRRDPRLGPPSTDSFTLGEKVKSLRSIAWPILLFLLVMGGLLAGAFTPTEAGAIGAFGAFIIALVKKVLSAKNLLSALVDSTRMTAMVIAIILAAMIYNSLIAISGLPVMLSKFVAGLTMTPLAILTVILLLYIPLGMFMETMSMIVLTLPIFFPIITSLGFDGIFFGVLIVVMMELSQITPPIGINVFVLAAVDKDIPMSEMFMGVVPFAVTMLVGVAIMVAFPQVALFLPRLMS